jgi:hypothetical protein
VPKYNLLSRELVPPFLLTLEPMKPPQARRNWPLTFVVMGREVVVAITKGKLDFGRWEQIFYGEFDGRRRKRVLVKIIVE